ncbi:MAG TPA: terminase [Blastocatellia bacterium]|nr:terminase [Blastocatellia bacterium]
MSAAKPELTEIHGARMALNFHAGQWRAWESDRRFIGVIAGLQSGKTVFGPPWLWREIKLRGPGDYLVGTPTYPLLDKKALPEFIRLFEKRLQLGHYIGGAAHKFVFSREGELRTFGRASDQPTIVYFGHAQDADSLESATYKAAWLDEAGQRKFRRDSWIAIQGRLSINQGRALITTTPYDLGWLKVDIYDKWKAGDPDYDVIGFRSIDNPVFPPEEYDRMRAELPDYKFRLRYDGEFTRPEGLIYSSFIDEYEPAGHKRRPFPIPLSWPRYVGLDFGGVNTAAIFLAEDPNTKRLYAYREYLAGDRTAAEHSAALRKGEPDILIAVGGSASEQQWRKEFKAAGLPVRHPDIKEVEVGIDRVYGAFKRDEICIFDNLSGLLAELGSYCREVDEQGNITEKIEDKERFHRLDALRYIISWLRRPMTTRAREWLR